MNWFSPKHLYHFRSLNRLSLPPIVYTLYTALPFEALAIEWLKEASQKAVGEQLGLSWDEIHALMERAVKRGLQRREAESVSKIGVDEKAFRKGHSYFTLVNDLVRSRVMYVAEGRQQSSLDGF